MTHPLFRDKLEAIGFGCFTPIFFVTSGPTFDLTARFVTTSAVLRIPVFVAAMVFVRACRL